MYVRERTWIYFFYLAFQQQDPVSVCCLAIVHSVMFGDIMVPGLLTVPSETEQPVSVTDPGATAMRGQFWKQQDFPSLPLGRAREKAFFFFSVTAIMDKPLWQKMLEGLNIPLSLIAVNSCL